MSIKYTKEHEWVRLEGDAAVIGISDYAQEQLGEIVFVELPDTGTQLDKGAEACVIESVKAASEVYAPASGEVTEINADL
ncbi:MAG: glycine cleavage system protein H, partial [Bacteroidetes bacterium]|nr:glycine cleavage system protein H [Bacteroidota bacterium]